MERMLAGNGIVPGTGLRRSGEHRLAFTAIEVRLRLFVVVQILFVDEDIAMVARRYRP
jgi:hypothetical protein